MRKISGRLNDFGSKCFRKNIAETAIIKVIIVNRRWDMSGPPPRLSNAAIITSRIPPNKIRLYQFITFDIHINPAYNPSVNASQTAANFDVQKKEVLVDRDTCIGCMLCAIDYPNVFLMDESGKAVAQNPSGDSEENLQKAIELCPTQSIQFVPPPSLGNL